MKDGTTTPPRTDTAPPKDDRVLALSTSRPDISPPQVRRSFSLWIWLLGGALVIFLSLTLIQWLRGGFPFSLLPTSSLNPHGVLLQNSPPATSSFSSITVGHADKVAFLNASNIWVSDLDGSNLIQLTTDAVNKSNLRWTPDGQSVIYTSANCLHLVGLQTKQILTLACFSGVVSIDAIDVSPDGQDIAIVLAQSDLYIFPYAQLFRLRQSSLPEDLSSLSPCSYNAPYHSSDRIKAIYWSETNDHLAVLLSKSIAGTNRDEINILDFSQCAPAPLLETEILSTYFLFTLRGYYDRPEIPSFSWNGNDQLLVNSYQNESGFGDLLLYNLDQNLGLNITPNGSCCYRDAHWSPDGSYIFYAYQPEAGGQISLYFAPTGKITQTGTISNPIPMPTGFFADPLVSLQPALRKAP